MDIVLEPLDRLFLTPHVYPSWIPEDNWLRQLFTLWVLTTVGGVFLVMLPDAINYYCFFDHRLMKHRRFLPNQVKQEIMYTLWSIPYMAVLTALMFVLELQGYSQLYDNVSDMSWGWGYIALTIPCFLFFTDCGIYWIHFYLHHPKLYWIHKPHHKWIICTPFASHAFHPIDGFSQSFPYHLYVFLFPMHKYLYLMVFMVVNFWTVSIHDGIYKVPTFLEPFINGSAHHTDHHTDYNYNYGQYFTLWDRIGGTFKYPSGLTPGKSIYDQVDRYLKGVEEDDPMHGVDPADRVNNNTKTVENTVSPNKKSKKVE